MGGLDHSLGRRNPFAAFAAFPTKAPGYEWWVAEEKKRGELLGDELQETGADRAATRPNSARRARPFPHR